MGIWYRRGTIEYPAGISVDPSYGNVYVVDLGNNGVQKFDTNGNLITTWGSRGSGNGQFFGPWGIFFNPLYGNNVYVADTGNERIQEFDSNGKFIATWGTFGYRKWII